VRRAPWWLTARRAEDRLVLEPRNLGVHRGSVVLEAGGARLVVPAEAHLVGGWREAACGALLGLLALVAALGIGSILTLLMDVLADGRMPPTAPWPGDKPFHTEPPPLSLALGVLLVAAPVVALPGLLLGGLPLLVRSLVAAAVLAGPYLLLTHHSPYNGFGFAAGLVLLAGLWGRWVGGNWLARRSALAVGAGAGVTALEAAFGHVSWIDWSPLFWASVVGASLAPTAWCRMWGAGAPRPLARPPGLTDVSAGRAPEIVLAEWPRVRSDEARPIELPLPPGLAETLRVRSVPWWLQAELRGDCLWLRVRNCGSHSGAVDLTGKVDGEVLRFPVRSDVLPELPERQQGAISGFVAPLVGGLVGLVAGSLLTGLLGAFQPDPFGSSAFGFIAVFLVVIPLLTALGMFWFLGEMLNGDGLNARSAGAGAAALVPALGLAFLFGIGYHSFAPPVVFLVFAWVWGALVGGRWLAAGSALVGLVPCALWLALRTLLAVDVEVQAHALLVLGLPFWSAGIGALIPRRFEDRS
jgi:hypothetical protein